MKKLLSIFMSMVMVVTMLPKVSFAEVGKTESTVNEEQQAGGTEDKKDNVNTDSEGVFKFLQDKFSLLANYLKEKAPKVWDFLKPYVEKGKNWGKDYYKSASEFASEVGKLGVVVTVALSALTVKIAYKLCKAVVSFFDSDTSKQNRADASTYIQPSNNYSSPYVQY